MAWTVTVQSKGVEGNHRVVALDCTADAATQNVDSGLDYIDHFTIGIKSLSTAGVKIYENSGAAGTSLVGILGCSGFVSGDQLFIKCYGR
jgi:hypothetical protein